jgi:hypothetical protein
MAYKTQLCNQDKPYLIKLIGCRIPEDGGSKLRRKDVIILLFDCKL